MLSATLNYAAILKWSCSGDSNRPTSRRRFRLSICVPPPRCLTRDFCDSESRNSWLFNFRNPLNRSLIRFLIPTDARIEFARRRGSPLGGASEKRLRAARNAARAADNLVGNFELRCDLKMVKPRRFEPAKESSPGSRPSICVTPSALSGARVFAAVKTAIRGFSIFVTH